MNLLRIMTAGSVDDGKSTLIGRLFYDTGKILKDQMGALERASGIGAEVPNLAFFTDGLKAEREKGITIDVAYRYFSSDRRKYILADAPGHLEYTRNMITAASHSDVALILVDAARGIFPQTRRHAWIARWMGLKIVFCINKMDLVAHDEKRFNALVSELCEWMKIDRKNPDVSFVPMSALLGENLVKKTNSMPWYSGSTVFETIENLEVERAESARPLRLPIQLPIETGFAGTVASGVLKTGQALQIAGSKTPVTILKIMSSQGPLKEAPAGHAVMIYLNDATELARGDLIEDPAAPTSSAMTWEVELCYLRTDALSLRSGDKLKARLNTQLVDVEIEKVSDEFHLDRLAWTAFSGDELHSNQIVRARLRFKKPISADAFEQNASCGRMILIHEKSGDTMAAALFRRPL